MLSMLGAIASQGAYFLNRINIRYDNTGVAAYMVGDLQYDSSSNIAKFTTRVDSGFNTKVDALTGSYCTTLPPNGRMRIRFLNNANTELGNFVILEIFRTGAVTGYGDGTVFQSTVPSGTTKIRIDMLAEATSGFTSKVAFKDGVSFGTFTGDNFTYDFIL